jgi:hypothetical protein
MAFDLCRCVCVTGDVRIVKLRVHWVMLISCIRYMCAQHRDILMDPSI